MTTDRLPHLIVAGFFTTEKYTAKQGFGPDYPLPAATAPRTAIPSNRNSKRSAARTKGNAATRPPTTNRHPFPSKSAANQATF